MSQVKAGQVLSGAVDHPPVSARVARVEVRDLRGAARTPVVPNLFHFARLTELMLDHFGDHWLTTGSIDVRYVTPLHVGDTLQPHARITNVTPAGQGDGGVTVHMDIWCANQRGEELARGTASCVLPHLTYP